jgi:hypothetical protein
MDNVQKHNNCKKKFLHLIDVQVILNDMYKIEIIALLLKNLCELCTINVDRPLYEDGNT